jgi:hypothetical protein
MLNVYCKLYGLSDNMYYVCYVLCDLRSIELRSVYVIDVTFNMYSRVNQTKGKGLRGRHQNGYELRIMHSNWIGRQRRL